MAHIERMETECPPDAHKVIRPPENEVKATICVKLTEQEAEQYGEVDFCNTLSLMSSKPLILCSDKCREMIAKHKKDCEIEPCYLQVSADGTEANISYDDGAQGPSMPCVDLSKDPKDAERFLDELTKKQFIIIDSYAMLILRSISTVYPWDKLLANDYLRQYLQARADITQHDLDLFIEVRYGRKDGFGLKSSDPKAYRYLQIERKLFLQYPAEDDD